MLDGRYVLLADNRVRFQIEEYDRSRPLVIDPVVSYSTFFGGSNGDAINAIALDASGNISLTGEAGSLDFPIVNAFQAGLNRGVPGAADAFVSKLAPDGKTLIYSTYLGGTDSDAGNAIAVDSSGSAYITGDTNSNDFPTLNPIQAERGGGQSDAFVAKLAPDGSALVYSTYLGGGANDHAAAIALDPTGNAYVAGTTDSSDFPHTAGAFQTSFGGEAGGSCYFGQACGHAFVTKINPSGSAFTYSTFLGGSGGNFGDGIAVDSRGNAYVTGRTSSSDFPVTPGAYQTGLAGYGDAFVTKLSADGASLVYSTYLGPVESFLGGAIAVDTMGRAYVAGTTRGPDFPATSTLGNAPPGALVGFVTKLHPAGCALGYSTSFPGPLVENALAIDSNGNAYVAGGAQGGLPTLNPVQNACSPSCVQGYDAAFVSA
ncbi:MAG TPA: SBBP repeat-containing protein, partial [Candidatus Binatia bacterium]|nr:SBBP repeat-containing protein [Candidatus Binatia bacterium]